MLSELAFRAQLVTQGQRELYDYWRKTAGSRRMPARSDINPFSVPKLLPCVGLIDLTEGLDEARFRLAGTRLRDSPRCGPRTVARTRPYRLVLVAVAAFAGWNEGRSDPLL